MVDVHIVLDAPSSIIEGDEFYDAVDNEGVVMDSEILSKSMHHLVDILAEELGMDDFGPSEEEEEIEEFISSSSEGSYGSRLLEYLVSNVISGMTMNIVNLTVSLHSSSLSIPILKISQGFDSFIYNIELPKGLAIKSESESKPLFGTEELVDMEVILEEMDGSPPCWSLRIFDASFTLTSQIMEELKYLHRVFKKRPSSPASSVDYLMLGSIKLFRPRLELIDKSAEIRTLTAQIISINLNGEKDFEFHLSGFDFSSSKGTLLTATDLTVNHAKVEAIRKTKVELSPIKVGVFDLVDMKMIEDFVDRDLAKSIQYRRPTWSISIGVPSIVHDPAMGHNSIFSQLEICDIQASIGPLQMHCHLSSGILKTTSFDLALKKASLYRTCKTVSKPLIFPRNPFDPTYTLIEDQEFIRVLRDPEDYFLLRSGVIDDSETHYHVTIDSINLLMREFQEFNPAFGSAKGEKSRCSTCSIINCNVEVEPMNISLQASSIDGLYDSSFCDIRMDLASVDWKGFDVQRKVLNPSLDPHFKTFILTCRLEESMTISSLLSGSLLRIPIEDLLANSAKSQGCDRTNPFDSVSRLFINMELCSFQPVLPSHHHRRCPPHVLYAQSLRAVHLKNSKLIKAFLTSGEVFLAPSLSFLAEATGLFAEGHNYWEEQNYECVGGVDFLPVTLDLSHSFPQLRIETNTIEFDLYRDSLFTLKRLYDVYMAFFSERATLLQPQQGPEKQEFEREHVFSGLFGTMDPAESDDGNDVIEKLKTPHLNVNEKEEENILYGSAFSNVSPLRAELESMEEMVKDSDHYLRALQDRKDSWSSAWEIEIPDEVIKSEDFTITTATTTLDESGEESGLDVDENFFKLGDSLGTSPTCDFEGVRFPFSSSNSKDLKGRVHIVNATLVLRLHEGRHWTPDKNARISSRSRHFAFDSESPTSSSHSHRSRMSVAASSTRWSQPSALAAASSKPGQQPHDYVEVRFEHINSELDWTNPYPPPHEDVSLLSAMRISIDNIQVLDHVRSSRWKTFATRCLTNKFDINRNEPLLKASNEVFFIPHVTRPVTTLEEQLETSLKIELQPLRFHIDQDTLVFILQFIESATEGNSKRASQEITPDCVESDNSRPSQSTTFIRINLKLDYKPKKVDLRNMFLGQYLELLNLFELEDAEVALPSTNLHGISSGEQLVTALMHTWMPHVRNTQVCNVVGGVPPIRTAVNLGSGVADLFILPIKCYKRDGQVMRGLRQGVASFLYSTALEGARMGKRLASGAQTILEHADDVFSPNPLHSPHDHTLSKYSEPPVNVVEGLLKGKETIETSLKSTAQTIIAVPMEVYERVGPGGALKEVLRAVPVALIRPMIGTSAAISRTLLGVESTLDPIRGAEIKQKYKTVHDQHAAYLATSAVSTDSIPEESVFEEFYHKNK